MSYANAQDWMRKALQRSARRDALRQLDDAVAEGRRLVITVGRELAAKGQGCVAQWDGDELSVLPLTPAQLHALGIRPNAMSCQTSQLLPGQLPAAHRCGLSRLAFQSQTAHNGRQPLAGQVVVSLFAPPAPLPFDTALVATYYHPALNVRQTVRHFSYLADPVTSSMPVPFEFPPLLDAESPPVHGPLAVFVQLCEVQQPAPQMTCRPISFVNAAPVTLA